MSTPARLLNIDLETLNLLKGSHHDRERGMCVMEAVAYIAGEPHSDRPACACPVITALMIRWNDGLPSDEERNQWLRPLVPLLVGTRSTREVQKARGKMARDFLFQSALPALLTLAGLPEYAAKLQATPTLETARECRDAARARRVQVWKEFVYADAATAAAAAAAVYVYAYAAAAAAAYALPAKKRAAILAAVREKFTPLREQMNEGLSELVKKMIAVKEEEVAA
jgi:hypothetical protein